MYLLLYGTRMDAKVTVGISASLLNISLWESDARKHVQDPFSSSQTTFAGFIFVCGVFFLLFLDRVLIFFFNLYPISASLSKEQNLTP